MREIVLDTETTGYNYEGDDRVVEIGCVELINHVPTQKTFQCYINPKRDSSEGAFKVHGLSSEFLSQHKIFSDIAENFIEFIKNDPLIIHNAKFDIGFLNAEFKRIGYPLIPIERAIDTVVIARKMFPGAQANLDALCRRFQIDNTNRAIHGALKDANLLASVYLELIGGRQPDFELSDKKNLVSSKINSETIRKVRPHKLTNSEQKNHDKFINNIENPLWHLK